MRTLEPNEIREVEQILHERHPLYYNGASFHDLFPTWKKYFWKQEDTEYKFSSRVKELSQILPNNVSRSDEVLSPIGSSTNLNKQRTFDTKKTNKSIDILGYGVTAFFDIQRYLIFIYIFIFILSLPSIYYFWKNEDINVWPDQKSVLYSIGNIGNAEAAWSDTNLVDTATSINFLELQKHSILQNKFFDKNFYFLKSNLKA